MNIEQMNWMMVEKYLRKDKRVILIIGACEQHGYLSLLTDIKIPLAIAEAASQNTGVLVAPPLNFGISTSFLTYPGTISFRTTTLMDAVEDIVRSLYGVGFRKFMVINGHGGNLPVRSRLHEMMNVLDDLQAIFYSWWMEPNVQKVMEKHGVPGFHGGWMESFNFTRVVDLPKGEKKAPKPTRMLNAKENRKTYQDGVYGGRFQPDDKILDEIFRIAVADIFELLKFK
jgi:creatinine amidohydrolase